MTVDNQKMIQAMINAQWLHEQEAEGKHAHPGHIITVSRQCGSMGEEVALALSDRLKVPYFDKELVEKVAESAGIDPQLFLQLEEKVHKLKPSWLETVFTNRPWLQAQYNKNLISVLLGISRVGGIVLGRGANFVLGQYLCFRLRIVGSVPVRAERYASHHNLDFEEAKRKVLEIDEERANFVRAMFHRDINNPARYDMVINSDRLSTDTMVELALNGIRSSEFCGHALDDLERGDLSIPR